MAQATFRLSVSNVNDAPTLAMPIADQIAKDSTPFSFTLPGDTFADVDAGDMLSLSAMLDNGDPLPSWLKFDSVTQTFSGSPGDEQLGAFSIRVSATDSGNLAVSESFGLTVSMRTDCINVIHGTKKEDGIAGGDCNDVIYADKGGDMVYGNRGHDYLRGEEGKDKLYGGSGYDILDGGKNKDTLDGATANDLLLGGHGEDRLSGGDGDDLLAGGPQNDVIDAGAGDDLILYNLGDGHDVVLTAGSDGYDTLSLGGGLRASDLRLKRSGSDLVLKFDEEEGNSLTFADWYAAPANRNIVKLQVIADAVRKFEDQDDDVSEQSSRKPKVETYDFQGIVDSFDQARAANARMNRWALSDALLDCHLATSAGEALGGDLAYQYGKNGTLSAMSLGAAQSVLSQPQFGMQPQALQALAGLGEGNVKLAA